MTILNVFFGGQPCGQVEQTSTGNLSFRYHDEYRFQPTATPLSLSMPLAARDHPKRSVLPFLQGLLPDSEGALEAFAIARDELVSQIPDANPVADVLVRNIGRLPLILAEREV